MFVFVLFLGTSLFLKKLPEYSFLFVVISAQIIPVSVTFYFALSWKTILTLNEGYLLVIAMLVLSAQLMTIPVAASLLSKITPVSRASFYQSLIYTAVHTGIILSRLTAGATFGEMPMMYICFGLTFFWLFGIIWLGFERKNFIRLPYSDVENQ